MGASIPVPDEELLRALSAWKQCGRSRAKARELLGLAKSTFDDRLSMAFKRFGRPGFSPEEEGAPPPPELPEDPAIERETAQGGWAPDYGIASPLPEGLRLKGVSTYNDGSGAKLSEWVLKRLQGRDPAEAVRLADPKKIVSVSTMTDQQGRVTAQWVKERPDELPLSDLVAVAVGQFLAGVPDIPIPDGPGKFDGDVIPWFQIGDAHLGMLAHEAETGANFDLKIAERELCTAFSTLFNECPARERCVINDVGDATHYENMAAVTEASRHAMDADGRFPKMIGVYSRTMRFILDRALEKFQTVDVIVNQGNHSRTNDIWMAELLRQVYANTGRVNVLDNSAAFIAYRMGNTFVMTHHGDKTRPERLAQVMSNDFRQDWGETEYHYIDVGHLHHKWSSKENAGCVIEMWNTLAGKDNWHTASGYRSQQSITRVDRSKTYGEVGRRVLPIKEIRDIIARSYGSSAYIPPERRKVFSV